jgi:hypothetical protein
MQTSITADVWHVASSRFVETALTVADRLNVPSVNKGPAAPKKSATRFSYTVACQGQ